MSEDEGTIGDPDETEEADGMIDPSTGVPFPDTPEGREAKKRFLGVRRDARHPKGGPPGQHKRDVADEEADGA